MSSVLWAILRILFIALFALEGAKMARNLPPYPSDESLWVSLPIMFIFAAWRFCSILRHKFEKKREKDDWAASLWTSPILKNPESFFFIGGFAFVAAATVGFLASPPDSGSVIPLFFMTFGTGVLSGWGLFRIRTKRRANQRATDNDGAAPRHV